MSAMKAVLVDQEDSRTLNCVGWMTVEERVVNSALAREVWVHELDESVPDESHLEAHKIFSRASSTESVPD
eukprot:1317916-Amorphochlora_amoeboformis.AAC.1